MRSTSQERPAGFAPLVENVVEGLGALVAGHIKLARVELEETARVETRRIGLIALAGALGALGYALVAVAAALALAGPWGGAIAFLVVGGGHLALGAGALFVVLRRASKPPLRETLSQLDHTVSLLVPRKDEAHVGH
ncbi:MAG TPA: phage holin family protein [Polyangia bacterium]|nr:phage holin family protein [Polyangia bacterium]